MTFFKYRFKYLDPSNDTIYETRANSQLYNQYMVGFAYSLHMLSV